MGSGPGWPEKPWKQVLTWTVSGAVLLSENDVAHFKLAERDAKRVVLKLKNMTISLEMQDLLDKVSDLYSTILSIW